MASRLAWLDTVAARVLRVGLRRPAEGVLFPLLILALTGGARLLRAEHALLARGLSVAALLAILFAGLVLVRLVSLQRSYARAAFEGDTATMRRLRALFEGDGIPTTARELAARSLGEGELLLAEERWAEARDVLAGIDRTALPSLVRPGILSELGYATALSDDPARGVTLARDAYAEALATRGYPTSKRFYLLLRLGVALVAAGDHEEAERALFAAVRISQADGKASAELAFALARSFRARGNAEESTRWLELAAKGQGAWARRAEVALASAARSPHRDPGPLDVPLRALPEASDDELDEAAFDREPPPSARRRSRRPD